MHDKPDLPDNDYLLGLAERDTNLSTPTGHPIVKLPEGAQVRDLPAHADDRGTLFECYDESWGWHPAPLNRVYCTSILPGMAKGWNVHQEHEDRYIIVQGEFTVAMYDARPDSSTFRQCFTVLLSDRRRRILTMPIGVWHCDYNLSDKEAILLNCPTNTYNYESPDKYRLPLYTEAIPYTLPPGLKGY